MLPVAYVVPTRRATYCICRANMLPIVRVVPLYPRKLYQHVCRHIPLRAVALLFASTIVIGILFGSDDDCSYAYAHAMRGEGPLTTNSALKTKTAEITLARSVP